MYFRGPMEVLNFGGSSLATPSHLRDVGRIVLDEARRERVTVVVSAFQGVTNQLLDAARLAERGDTLHERSFDAIARRHRAAVDVLTSDWKQQVQCDQFPPGT